MKKIIPVILIATTCATTSNAALFYAGPPDERTPPGLNPVFECTTLGWIAQYMDVGAVADVYDEGAPTPEMKYGYLKVRVVIPIYGCTNGQEIVVAKHSTAFPDLEIPEGLPFEYYPTNNSRIVFAGFIGDKWNSWEPKDWRLPPQPEVIINSTNNPPILDEFTRSWWYDGYQDDLPYAHLTNLVRAARVERNWTNFYYIIRDNIPNPSSPRV